MSTTKSVQRTSPARSRRQLEHLIRGLRRKHFQFAHLDCPGCIARARRQVARANPFTRIEAALIDYGDERAIAAAYPAVALLIQNELEEALEWEQAEVDF